MKGDWIVSSEMGERDGERKEEDGWWTSDDWAVPLGLEREVRKEK